MRKDLAPQGSNHPDSKGHISIVPHGFSLPFSGRNSLTLGWNPFEFPGWRLPLPDSRPPAGGRGRESFTVKNHCRVYELEEDPAHRTFFSEIIGSLSDVKFSPDGRFIVARDYLGQGFRPDSLGGDGGRAERGSLKTYGRWVGRGVDHPAPHPPLRVFIS